MSVNVLQIQYLVVTLAFSDHKTRFSSRKSFRSHLDFSFFWRAREATKLYQIEIFLESTFKNQQKQFYDFRRNKKFSFFV